MLDMQVTAPARRTDATGSRRAIAEPIHDPDRLGLPADGSTARRAAAGAPDTPAHRGSVSDIAVRRRGSHFFNTPVGTARARLEAS